MIELTSIVLLNIIQTTNLIVIATLRTFIHDKIIFTRTCSEKLRAMQLHIDVDGAKQTIKKRNNFRFFQQNSQTGFINEYLPPEIASKISSAVNFKVEDRKLSEQEIIERDQEYERYHNRY